MARKRKSKIRGLSQTPEKVQQVQELRRSNASGKIVDRTPRSEWKRRAIQDQE